MNVKFGSVKSRKSLLAFSLLLFLMPLPILVSSIKTVEKGDSFISQADQESMLEFIGITFGNDSLQSETTREVIQGDWIVIQYRAFSPTGSTKVFLLGEGINSSLTMDTSTSLELDQTTNEGEGYFTYEKNITVQSTGRFWAVANTDGGVVSEMDNLPILFHDAGKKGHWIFARDEEGGSLDKYPVLSQVVNEDEDKISIEDDEAYIPTEINITIQYSIAAGVDESVASKSDFADRPTFLFDYHDVDLKNGSDVDYEPELSIQADHVVTSSSNVSIFELDVYFNMTNTIIFSKGASYNLTGPLRQFIFTANNSEGWEHIGEETVGNRIHNGFNVESMPSEEVNLDIENVNVSVTTQNATEEDVIQLYYRTYNRTALLDAIDTDGEIQDNEEGREMYMLTNWTLVDNETLSPDSIKKDSMELINVSDEVENDSINATLQENYTISLGEFGLGVGVEYFVSIIYLDQRYNETEILLLEVVSSEIDLVLSFRNGNVTNTVESIIDYSIIFPKGNVETLTFSFGDGSDPIVMDTVLGGSPVNGSETHFYEEEGIYNVSITTNVSYGVQKIVKDTIIIDLVSPVVEVTSSTNASTVSVKVEASDNFTGIGEVIVDWGDGVSEFYFIDSDSSLNHTYTMSGTYTIQVTVSDQAGNQVLKTVNVTIDVEDTVSGANYGFAVVVPLFLIVSSTILVSRRIKRERKSVKT